MAAEAAVRNFLAHLETTQDPTAVAKYFRHQQRKSETNLLLEFISCLTGDEDVDEPYVRCVYWALLVASPLDEYAEQLREAAEAFIEKSEQRHPEHWASVAACIALLSDDYPIRLAVFSFSPQFLTSVFTHPTILTDSTTLGHFENGLNTLIKDLQRAGTPLVLRSLGKTIEEEGTAGCLENFFADKAKSRSLMEVVKFGTSRKRNRDGSFVLSSADESLRAAVMDLVKALCTVSVSLFKTYVLSWDGPTDSDQWQEILVFLFGRYPSFFAQYVDHAAPRNRQHIDDWWTQASHVAKIVDACDLSLDLPSWFDSSVNNGIIANGEKSLDALTILSKTAAKFTASRWKAFDVQAVCGLLFRLSIIDQLRLVSALIPVVRFPEILAKSVIKNSVALGEALLSDIDRCEFAVAYLNLVQRLLEERFYYDVSSVRTFISFVLAWKKSRPEAANHPFDVSLAGFLAQVEDDDAFSGLGRFCIAIKDSATLEEFDRSLAAKFTLVHFHELDLEEEGTSAWLSILNIVSKLHKLDASNKPKLSKVAKFITQSHVDKNVKQIVLQAIAGRLRGTAVDLCLTLDLMACWRRFCPSGGNFFEAIERWPSASELEHINVPKKGKVVEFLKECVEIPVDKGKAIYPVIAMMAPREVGVSAVRKGVSSSEGIDWLCRDLRWVQVVYADNAEHDEPLSIESLLSLKNRFFPAGCDPGNANLWRLVSVFFEADILSDEEVERIHALATKSVCEELKDLSAFVSLISAASTPEKCANIANLKRVKKFLNTHEGETRQLFEKATNLLSKRRKVETKQMVYEIKKVEDFERIGDVLFDWLLSSDTRKEHEVVVLRLIQTCSGFGKLELFSSSETVWRWIERWNAYEILSKPAQRLLITLMIYMAHNAKSQDDLDHLRKFLTADHARQHYRGTLDITEQLMVKLLAAVEKENFRQHDNILVGSLKEKLWALVDAEDARPMISNRHVCKTHSKVVAAVKLAPSLDGRRGAVFKDGKADCFDPRIFTFALLAMFKEIEEEYRPRYSVRAFVSLGFPAVPVACLSSKDPELRLAAACILRHLVEVVRNFKTSSILVKMWNDFSTVVLNTLAAASEGGEKLQPALPPAWTAFVSAGCLTFNDAASQLHKSISAFLFRSGHIKGCWSSFLPFLRFYNSLDYLGGKERRGVCRKFILDVCRRAAADSSTFEKEHALKIILGSFSVEGRGSEPEDILSTVKLMLERNITKRPTMMRSILDWGIAMLLENLPRKETKPTPAAVAFGALFGEILWKTWKSFLHPFLSALNFNLESSSAASESELFVDFALACSLVAALAGSDASFTLERRLACVAVEESLGLDVKSFVAFPPARLMWQRRFSAEFGTDTVDRDLALERRLLIFTRSPEIWENLAFDERCALQCALFGC